MDSDEEDFVFFGTPIEREDELASRKKKAVAEASGTLRTLPAWNQEVRDEEGRRRFHGAFTGGFSAGYFNTAGSKEGWAPQTFTSSRKNRADFKQQNILNFLDDDEKADFDMSVVVRDPVAGGVHSGRVTWEGCSVLLDINDGDRMVFSRLSHAATVKIGNKNYSLRPLIGCPFGSLFQVEVGADGPCLSLVDPSSLQGKEVPDSIDESKDNRALVDNNKAQTLTGEDINAMRSQGATGVEIVEALIANSATFENKTSLSQEKYRLKKQKKYAPKILVRRPFTRSICEAYFKKYPHRIGFLRVDTLSLLLSMANVTANSDILVVDMLSGILTGAVAERLGGNGFVCSTYMGSTPHSLDIVRMFNFTNEICKRIVSCSISSLSSSEHEKFESDGRHVIASEESQSVAPQPSDMEVITVSVENEASNNLVETNGSHFLKTCKSSKAGEPASAEVVQMWKENGFSSLIIGAPDLDPWSIIKQLLPFLSHSAPFAIYHQYLQPLATCMHNLQLEKLAIGLQLNEPWLREYQVLPARTHPHMQMSAFGGYILSGTKICANTGLMHQGT